MKEFKYSLTDIFTGLTRQLRDSYLKPDLSLCHNLVPLKENNYDIHTLIIDMNATGISWGGTGEFITDIWEDESDDDWATDDSDEFIDN